MMTKSLPAAQQRAEAMADLSQRLYRLEAAAALQADRDALAALDDDQRHALACQWSEAVSECRQLADAIEAM